MTTTMKATLFRLVAAKDVESLKTLLNTTTDRNDRTQITLAIRHASRRNITSSPEHMR